MTQGSGPKGSFFNTLPPRRPELRRSWALKHPFRAWTGWGLTVGVFLVLLVWLSGLPLSSAAISGGSTLVLAWVVGVPWTRREARLARSHRVVANETDLSVGESNNPSSET